LFTVLQIDYCQKQSQEVRGKSSTNGAITEPSPCRNSAGKLTQRCLRPCDTNLRGDGSLKERRIRFEKEGGKNMKKRRWQIENP